MAIQVCRTCDRCKNPYGEETFDISKPLPALQLQRPTLHISLKNPDGTEVVLASFTDLCPGCDTAVSNYLGNVRMDRAKKQGKKEKGAESKTESSEETAEAKPTEVSTVEPSPPKVVPTNASNGEQKPARPEAF